MELVYPGIERNKGLGEEAEMDSEEERVYFKALISVNSCFIPQKF